MKLGGDILSNLFRGATWRAYRGDTLMSWDEIKPLIGPNSIDVTLGSIFLRPVADPTIPVDPRDERTLSWETITATDDQHVILHPSAFLLGAVRERFVCEEAVWVNGGTAEPDPMKRVFGESSAEHGNRVSRSTFFAPMYEGRSSCGRLGLASHITAGFGDYGFGGCFTLELFNHFPYPLLLHPGMRIGQVAFEEVCQPLRYRGAYSGSDHYWGPVPPKLGPTRF